MHLNLKTFRSVNRPCNLPPSPLLLKFCTGSCMWNWNHFYHRTPSPEACSDHNNAVSWKGKKSYQAVPTVILILFLILWERLKLQFLCLSSSKHSSRFICFFFFFYGKRSDTTHATRYDNDHYIHSLFDHVKYLQTSHFPDSRLCTELRGILGVQKRPHDDTIFQKPLMNVYNLS